MTYDIQRDVQDNYLQFMLGEMVPAVQAQGLQMTGAWHTAYGEYPIRLVEFIADDQATIEACSTRRSGTNMERGCWALSPTTSKKILRVRDDQFQF